jgi:signal transduction histidine kinase
LPEEAARRRRCNSAGTGLFVVRRVVENYGATAKFESSRPISIPSLIFPAEQTTSAVRIYLIQGGRFVALLLFFC